MAQTITGRPAGPAQQPHEAVVLPARATRTGAGGATAEPYRFLFWYHPDSRWFVRKVDGEFCWLPSLRRMPLRPGVNGVRAVGKAGAVDYRLAQVDATTKGWVLVDPSTGPDGDYVREFSTDAGIRYADAWTTFQRAGSGYRARFDDAGYERWLRDLVARGVIASPPDWAREQYITEIERYRVQASARGDSAKVAEYDAVLAFARKSADAVELDPKARVRK